MAPYNSRMTHKPKQSVNNYINNKYLVLVVEQGGSSVSNPSTLLFVSALMMVASKNILF